MANREITFKGKPLTVHKATVRPKFNEKTVLVASTWDYVALWLRRQGQSKASFFWDHARHFHQATAGLPTVSMPLTAYYSFLNATKALLKANGIAAAEYHGVSGATLPGKTSLVNETVKFKTGGVLGELAKFLGEATTEDDVLLKDVLYNLGIHRTFDLTFKSAPELFVPVRNPRIVRSNRTNEAWFCAELDGKYATEKTVAKLARSSNGMRASVIDSWSGSQIDSNGSLGEKRPGLRGTPATTRSLGSVSATFTAPNVLGT